MQGEKARCVMAALSRGKRMLKAGLEKEGILKRRRRSPDAEAEFYCRSGLDKEFKVKYISDLKGYGVFSESDHASEDFLLQYVGDKLTWDEAMERKKRGAEGKMFFYTYNGTKYCIDAETTEGHICQYVNDSSEDMANAVMKLKVFNASEKLCLYARRDIKHGEEILYNYGDQSNLWWRDKANDFSDEYNFVSTDLDTDPFSVGSLVSSSDRSESDIEDEFGLSSTILPRKCEGNFVRQFDRRVPAPKPIKPNNGGLRKPGQTVGNNGGLPKPGQTVGDMNQRNIQTPVSQGTKEGTNIKGFFQNIIKKGEDVIQKAGDAVFKGKGQGQAGFSVPQTGLSSGLKTTVSIPVTKALTMATPVVTMTTSAQQSRPATSLPKQEPLITGHVPQPSQVTQIKGFTGFQYDDITPTGSENEVDNTSEDEEYDEESSESNGQGFGPQYTYKTADGLTATSTPITTKPAPVESPRLPASGTPISRKLFGTDDTRSAAGFQFGAAATNVGFGAPAAPFVFAPAVTKATPASSQSEAQKVQTGFNVTGADNQSTTVETKPKSMTQSSLASSKDEARIKTSEGGHEIGTSLHVVEDSNLSFCSIEVPFHSDSAVSMSIRQDIPSDSVEVRATPLPCDETTDAVEASENTKPGMSTSPQLDSKTTRIFRANTKQKPGRYCVYCKTVVLGGKLKRHMKRKHKCEKDIQEIICKPSAVQNMFFDKKRREGIYEYNIALMAEDKEPEMRERISSVEDQLRVCLDCKVFFSNTYFFKHKCVTQKPHALKPKLLQTASVDKIESDEGFKDILNRFRDGIIGDICRTNKTVKLIGYRHFNLRRHEEGKQDEVRKVVMAEMRELSKLFVQFQSVSGLEKSVEDMFSREHLSDLLQAVQQLVTVDVVSSDKKEKHGQKLFLDAVILRSVKTLQGHYAETMQDLKGKEMKYFKTAYKHKSNEVYPSARQTCVKNSLEKSRRPASLPNEIALRQLKEYSSTEIQDILKNYSVKKYAWLRNLVVARLTLYNSRRGEEASRILTAEWEDAAKGVWLPKDQIEKVHDPAEKFLLGKFKLVYLQGKGKKFVPVLVPIDMIQVINVLKDDRHNFGIKPNNIFLFATRHGDSHCSGWHAVEKVCKKAGISIPVNATQMRHRLSTIYASLDMSPEDQKIFFEHMGHDMNINKENYQCPQGVRTVCVMGKMLSRVDEEGEYMPFPETQNQQNSGTGFSARPSDDKTEKDEGQTNESDDSEKDDVQMDESDEEEVFNDFREKKVNTTSVKWSMADTKLLREYFKDCIFGQTEQRNNKGSLPSKDNILRFLEEKCPQSLAALTMQDQYKKVRVKLFNERKTLRLKTTENLKKMGFHNK